MILCVCATVTSEGSSRESHQIRCLSRLTLRVFLPSRNTFAVVGRILEPPAERNRSPQRNRRESWSYNPIGKRTYIDPSGNLLHPVPRDLDTRRIKDLEGKNLRDLRRAHCSSCSIDEDDEDDDEEDDDDENGSDRRRGNPDTSSSTCSGGYFAALAPEICKRAPVSSD